MDYNSIYESWLSNPLLCAEGIKELNSIKDDEKEKEYRFGGELAFGTAGMRGILGYGTNMMNIYTVRRATKGLADYILSLGSKAAARGVVISYDTRNYSGEFALNAAGVLIAAGVQVYLFAEPRPVPMLSFAVRRLKATAGIMITASHNPKEYNGYKVYGGDGAQLSPEATAVIVEKIKTVTDIFSIKSIEIKEKTTCALLTYVPASVERRFYKNVLKQRLSPKAVKSVGKDLKIVYTSLHGTGYTPVTTVLAKMGLKVEVVPEQIAFDGNFPTVIVPNPEDKRALGMGIALAEKVKADVVFGTDPDCDRLGVAVRDDHGEFVGLTGNQVGALLLDYILSRLTQTKKLPDNAAVVKSFVSTNLAKYICDAYGVELYETPVGFKFIGEKIKQFEKDGSGTFEFGFEESCGYLRGTYARDKDAVVASMLFAELCCWCAYRGKTVYGALCDIYSRFGYVYDVTKSKVYSGLNAMADMNAVVEKMRELKPEKISNNNVKAIRDYLSGEKTYSDGEKEKLEYSGLNCLYYELENGSFVCLRPSGTEPKLKIYYSVCAADREQCLKTFDCLSQAFEKEYLGFED